MVDFFSGSPLVFPRYFCTCQSTEKRKKNAFFAFSAFPPSFARWILLITHQNNPFSLVRLKSWCAGEELSPGITKEGFSPTLPPPSLRTHAYLFRPPIFPCRFGKNFYRKSQRIVFSSSTDTWTMLSRGISLDDKILVCIFSTPEKKTSLSPFSESSTSFSSILRFFCSPNARSFSEAPFPLSNSRNSFFLFPRSLRSGKVWATRNLPWDSEKRAEKGRKRGTGNGEHGSSVEHVPIPSGMKKESSSHPRSWKILFLLAGFSSFRSGSREIGRNP